MHMLHASALNRACFSNEPRDEVVHKIYGNFHHNRWGAREQMNPYWQIFGAWTKQIYGKLIQIWTSFPVIGLAHAQIFYKNWVSTPKKFIDEFSRNRFSSCPGNWNYETILDEFSRNRSVSHPEKLKCRKNFWMGFPGFANKGWNLFYNSMEP